MQQQSCQLFHWCLTAEEVGKLRYVTDDRTPTKYGVSTLDEVFEHLKGRCYINVNNLVTDIPGITAAVRHLKESGNIY